MRAFFNLSLVLLLALAPAGQGACSICGDGEVTQPANVVDGQGFGPDLNCTVTDEQSGGIPDFVCTFVQNNVRNICCGDSTPQPLLSPPTAAPTSAPTSAPTTTPTSPPTNAATDPIGGLGGLSQALQAIFENADLFRSIFSSLNLFGGL